MAPGGPQQWWYWGQTGEQVEQLLTQNHATLTDISPYIDVDGKLKFAVIMAQGGPQWWYWGQTGEQVGQLLTQNHATLTDISPYIDVDDTLKFAVIMAPGSPQQWWYWGQTGEQVGQLLTQKHARLTALTPIPTIPHYMFSLDSFQIRNTRSRHLDTDYVTFAVTVGNSEPQPQTKSMGDLNNGGFAVGLTFSDVAVADEKPVIVTYLIVNSGHQSQSEIDSKLESAATQLANAGAQAATTAIGSGVGALAGATIGGAVVPMVGAALGALAGWLASTLGSILFADCDGPVAAQQTPFLGRDLWLKTAEGPLKFSTDNPGTDSPHGCGSNSDYVVNWSITRA
jgi:hypothetical protein